MSNVAGVVQTMLWRRPPGMKRARPQKLEKTVLSHVCARKSPQVFITTLTKELHSAVSSVPTSELLQRKADGSTQATSVLPGGQSYAHPAST
jgi:hypothetical protein